MSQPNAPQGPSDSRSDAAPDVTRRSLAAQAMGRIEPETRAVVMPLHVSTTFIRDPDNGYSSGYCYARPDNATVREAEAVLAMLEGAEAGAPILETETGPEVHDEAPLAEHDGAA